MQSFIFDHYGYNVDKLVDDKFYFKGYTFFLLATNEDESEMVKLSNLTTSLSSVFNNDVVYIVKNKYDKLLSSY